MAHDTTQSTAYEEHERLGKDEQAILDTALRESDQLLAVSLHNDEMRRQRRRRIVNLSLLIGGAAMSTVLIFLVSGWLGGVQAPDSAGAGDISSNAPNPVAGDVEQAEDLTVAGWELWKQRKMAAAEEKFAQAVKLDPESTNAWNGLGWSRFNSGNADGAIEPFKKCVAITPEHPAALNGLGQVYLSKRQYDQALTYLNKAAPTAPAAWLGLTRIHLLQGNWVEAKKWAEKIVDEQPKNAEAISLLQAANAKQLSPALRRQIEPPKPSANPGNSETMRAWRLFNTGKMRSAQVLFQKQVKKNPDDLAAQNGLGFCLLASGNAKRRNCISRNV